MEFDQEMIRLLQKKLDLRLTEAFENMLYSGIKNTESSKTLVAATARDVYCQFWDSLTPQQMDLLLANGALSPEHYAISVTIDGSQVYVNGPKDVD